MRKTERKLFFLFASTTDAIAFESECKADAMPGRLLPVPGNIRAGCGMGFATSLFEEEEWEQYCLAHKLCYEKYLYVEI